MRLFTFRAGQRAWALPFDDVEEVVAGFQIEPLPLLPEAVPGVIGVRRNAVLAVDIARLAGGDSCAGGDVAIVVRCNRNLVALLVDSVGELAESDVTTNGDAAWPWAARKAGEAALIDVHILVDVLR